MMRWSLLSLLLMCWVTPAESTMVHFHGTVTDTTGTLNLEGVVISFLAGDDSSAVTTLADGSYSTYIDVEMNSTGIQDGPGPESFVLHQNYPNPFNPSTALPFDLNLPAQVSLHVFSVTGQKVRTLADGYFSAGAHSVIWDGRDDSGRPVSSGVYIYRLISNGTQSVRKMVLLDSGVSSAHVSVGAQRIAEPLSMSGSVTIIVDRAGYEQYREENITISSDQQELERDFGLTIQDFFPLAVGNTWTYKTDSGTEHTMSIPDSTIIQGNVYYLIEPWIPSIHYHLLECISPLWVRKNKHGDLVVRYQDEDITVFPFSITTLDTYEVNEGLCWDFGSLLVGIGNKFPDANLFVSAGTSLFPDRIVTPVGTFFECSAFLVDIFQFVDEEQVIVFLPNIGMGYIRSGIGDFENELINATVNGIYYP